MRKLIFLSLFIFLPTLCYGAAADDPCYPDQVPVDTPEECYDITELSWGGVSPAETLAPGTTGQVSVLNGLPPFTFELDGSGFTLDESAPPENRTREIHAGTCGAATITVTDGCQKSVTGQVYTSNGSWQEVENYDGDCVLLGKASDNCAWNNGYRFSTIKGSLRLDQVTNITHAEGTMNTKTYCQNCPEPDEASRVSCFSGWSNSCGACENNWEQGEYCQVHPHYCQYFWYLGTYCYSHDKTLYEWTCPVD